MLYICHPNNNTFAHKNSCLEWIYLGSKEGLERTLQVLDSTRRKYLGQDIEREADLIRDNFIDFIGRVSLQQKNKLLWYSSPVASKSVSQTTIFEQYVYLKILENLSQENKEYLAIIDNAELIHNLREMNIGVCEAEPFRSSKPRSCARHFKNAYVIAKYFIFYALSKILFGRDAIANADAIIYSPIKEGVFSNLPMYEDPYFGSLEAILLKSNFNVFRIMLLGESLKNILKIKKYFKNVISPYVFLTLSKLIKVITTKFVIAIDEGRISGIKDTKMLTYLLRNEERKENDSMHFREYLLYFYAFEGLNNVWNQDGAFIYLFENQPWEKMANMAMKRRKMIGYQHVAIPINWLDYTISVFEKEIPLPSVILTTGDRWAAFLKKYYQHVTIEIAGTTRLSHLWANKTTRKTSDSKEIVLALPGYPTVSLTLQRQILDILSDKQSYLHEYTIKVKPHPYLCKKDILFKDFRRFSNCQIVEKDFSQLLDSPAVVICSCSTTVFDALLSRCKTLYFIPEELSEGTEFFIREYLVIAYQSNFQDQLRSVLKMESIPTVDKNEYFSPPNYDVFLKYLRNKYYENN
ncbi:MAG: hypothetical protein Q8O13_07005 [Candidatus Omnitrophota bacterium]|nr:hypothetical protein [Candidatus Omnitrophota bacterium]